MTQAKPALLTVDDDPGVTRAVQRDLRRHYGDRFQIVGADSGEGALALLDELALRAQPVALMLVDQRMPGMSGVEFLEQALGRVPEAKKVLLTAYADTQAAIKAINDVDLDHYLMKPWDPPEEQLFPVVDDLLLDWQARAAADEAEGLRVIGHRWSQDSHRARELLVRNFIPFRWLDVERDGEARILLDAAGLTGERLPVVVFPDGETLEAPDAVAVANRVGLSTTPSLDVYDLVIVGGGPAGLASAVYGASEGLATVLVEREAPGGQASQSSRIENYLGFPSGLTGADLTRRASAQAQRFGAEMLTVQEVAGIEARGPARIVHLKDGRELVGKAVIISTGVAYRTLDVPGADRLAGRGLYYGGARAEAVACRDESIIVVGGANSAGQAALHFATLARRVTMLCRGASLDASMSRYLVERIEQTDNIDVRSLSALAEVHGDEHVEAVTMRHRESGDERLDASGVFVFIGATPRTDWVGDAIVRDDRGFVLSGPDLGLAATGRPRWPLKREPLLLETSLPGVFVAGDVRHQSVKRVASAVGEGAMAVQLVHQYLGEAA